MTDTQAEVTSIEKQLSGLSDRVSAAQIAAGEAGEDYVDAQVALANADADLKTAKAQAAAAVKARDKARVGVGNVYRAQQQGTGDGALELVTSSKGVGDIIDQDQFLRAVGRKTTTTLDEYSTAAALAASATERANAAAERQKKAAAAAKTKLSTANASAAALKKAVADTTAQRTTLISQLAAAQRTSVQIARERAAALEAERQRKAEEAARQRLLEQERQQQLQRQREQQERQAPRGGGGGGSDRGGGSGGSGGSGGGERPYTPPYTPPGGSSVSSAAQGRAAVAWAKTKVGYPYVYGAAGPYGYDCSGLTSSAWASAGINITRTSRSQYLAVGKVSYSNLRPGDLIFYARNTSAPSTIYHVVMYIGGNQIIEAPAPGLRVRITGLRLSGAMPYAGRP